MDLMSQFTLKIKTSVWKKQLPVFVLELFYKILYEYYNLYCYILYATENDKWKNMTKKKKNNAENGHPKTDANSIYLKKELVQ